MPPTVTLYLTPASRCPTNRLKLVGLNHQLRPAAYSDHYKARSWLHQHGYVITNAAILEPFVVHTYSHV